MTTSDAATPLRDALERSLGPKIRPGDIRYQGVFTDGWNDCRDAALRVAASLDALDAERLAEIVSDSLAATTEGTDWAEAPEPSDEPGSPYVLRLTNEIRARLTKGQIEPPDPTFRSMRRRWNVQHDRDMNEGIYPESSDG